MPITDKDLIAEIERRAEGAKASPAGPDYRAIVEDVAEEAGIPYEHLRSLWLELVEHGEGRLMRKIKDARFWMVWSPHGRAPTMKHWRREDAEREAQRLSAMNPDRPFYVLKAVGGFAAQAPKLSAIKMVADLPEDIPFAPEWRG